jgi:nucleoside-triphosphatase
VNNILITGLPGSGKTTLIRRLAGSLGRCRPVGFYTEEIREKGVRKGFEIVSLDGRKRRLAHAAFQGKPRIGRYGVDVPGFEDFLGAIGFTSRKAGVVIVDEIGRMECLSPAFIRLMRELLDSRTLLVATVARIGEGFIREVKGRGDVEIIDIDPGNGEIVLQTLRDRLGVHGG